MTGSTTETTDVTATTEDFTTTAPITCVADQECGGETPFCVDGDCVGCDSLDCSAIDPGKPVCAADLGLCVECLENADCTTVEAPACDVATATCEPCSSHDQCADTACNFETGACFPKDSLLYVENTPEEPIGCSDVKPDYGGSPATPVCTLQNAFVRLVPGVATTIKLKIGTKPQNSPAALPDGDLIVAIVPEGKVKPSIVTPFAGPALTIGEGNTVFMDRIMLYNTVPTSDPLIACLGGVTGARLWLEEQRVFSGRTGIRAFNCQVHVRRSTITGNTIGGIDVDGDDAALAKLWLENSFVTENNGTKFGALRLTGAVDVDILYSTIALNNSPFASIECINGWSGALTIRNSAIVGADPHFGAGCGAPEVTNSFESSVTDKGELGTVFSGYAEGVFQAKIDGELEGVAIWQTGDPRTDQDENLRPTNDGAEDYAGADRPVL
jgi:hypothetical protein